MNPIGRLSVTANTAFFSHHSFTEMRNIMHVKKVPVNELIFMEGDQENKLFIVLEGTVQLAKLNDKGKNLAFHYFFPDDLFGEFNPRQEHVNTFTARAIEDTVIGVMYQHDFEALLMGNADLAIEFSQWQSQMHRFTQYKMRDLLFHGKDGALASTLLRAANTYGVKNKQSISLTKKITNNELADMVGTSRETVNRMLAAFKKSNMIAYTKGRLEILDTPGLKALCHCEECPVSICRL